MGSDLSPDELRGLRSFFLEEATEYLDAIDEAVGVLEGRPADAAALSLLLRRLHTLKGSAGSVDLPDLSRGAHVVEDRVVAIRDAGRSPSANELEELATGVADLRELLSLVARQVHGSSPAAKVPPATERAADRERRSAERRSDAMHIRVEVDQVDALMDAVGELVIDRTRIARRALEIEGCVREVARLREVLRIAAENGMTDPATMADLASELDDAVAALERASTGMNDDHEHLRRTSQVLKDGLEQVRMMEVGRLFARLGTPLREMARRTGRRLELTTSGERTAIDKAVVERIAEPLLHLLRNAVAHGIEPVELRRARGKPEVGRVEVSARQRGAEIILDIADDGAGVDLHEVRRALVRARRRTAEEAAAMPDAEVMAVIFDHGVSTRSEVDDMAGRGVGLDAVKEAVEALGGVIGCASTPGRGTRFTIRLPLTTAIARALLFKVGGHVYAVPAANVVETGHVAMADVHTSADGQRLAIGGRELPLVRLGVLLGEPAPPGPTSRRAAVVLSSDGGYFAATCDKLIGPREIVVKGLGPLLSGLELFSGATVSGAGKVQLLFDVEALAACAGRTALDERPPFRESAGATRVLLADDSHSVREAARMMLAQGGYAVETVPDGWEAWELLQDRRFDLLLTDGEMPRLDGYELAARVRRHPHLSDMAVVVMTSRPPEEARTRARDAGADVFVEKPLGRAQLLQAVDAALAARPPTDNPR
jgi:chemotaxis protein histidine kinase CheA/ActR/RegA family two-component response regulator